MHPSDEISAIFECLSPPFWAIYYAFAFLFEENFSQICIRNYQKMEVNRQLLQRILHQNTSQYAPKRSAFCTKTQCNLHQNAVQFASKRSAICTKMQGKCCKMHSKTHKKHHFKRYLQAFWPFGMKNRLVDFGGEFIDVLHP